MGGDRAAALGALVQFPGMPGIGRLARTQAHLRGFAFWDSHGSAYLSTVLAEGNGLRPRDSLNRYTIELACEPASVEFRVLTV